MKLEQPENLQSQSVTSDFSLNNITVSSKGYLMFHSVNDIVAYSKLLNSSSRDSVLSNLQSKGFLKKSTIYMYSKEGDDPYNLYFDEDGLMQVEDILIKISSNEKFLYIIKEQNLDPELYSKLISEIYDELKMDKINVDRLEENFDLLGMVDFTPFGINETENTSGNKRPMFGHTNDDCGLHSNAKPAFGKNVRYITMLFGF